MALRDLVREVTAMLPAFPVNSQPGQGLDIPGTLSLWGLEVGSAKQAASKEGEGRQESRSQQKWTWSSAREIGRFQPQGIRSLPSPSILSASSAFSLAR